MTDNVNINVYEGLTSNQQLNLFKNFYYNDGFSTEKGIIASAINDILPKYHKQQAELENLKVENQSLRTAANSLKMHYEKAQAEIERLKNEYEESKKRNQDLVYAFQSYKSKAYKEFADKVVHDINAYCENIRTKPSVDGVTGMKIANDLIYKRVNEMEGNNNGNS